VSGWTFPYDDHPKYRPRPTVSRLPEATEEPGGASGLSPFTNGCSYSISVDTVGERAVTWRGRCTRRSGLAPFVQLGSPRPHHRAPGYASKGAAALPGCVVCRPRLRSRRAAVRRGPAAFAANAGPAGRQFSGAARRAAVSPAWMPGLWPSRGPAGGDRHEAPPPDIGAVGQGVEKRNVMSCSETYSIWP
jgi:hypothetical protein